MIRLRGVRQAHSYLLLYSDPVLKAPMFHRIYDIIMLECQAV
jgi:hypothetical protein